MVNLQGLTFKKGAKKMSKTNWLDVEGSENKDVMVIDIGYVTEESARNRTDEILALGVGRGNLISGPSTRGGRIHINIPKTKQKKILAVLGVSDKKTWFGATHSYH